MTYRKIPRPAPELSKERALAAREATTVKGAKPDDETLNFAVRANLALQIVSNARNKKRKTASGMDPKAAMAQVQRQMAENGLRIVAVGTQDDDEGPVMGTPAAQSKQPEDFTQMLSAAQGIDLPGGDDEASTLAEDIEAIAAIDDVDAVDLERELLSDYTDDLPPDPGIMLSVDEVLDAAGVHTADLPPEPVVTADAGLSADDMDSMGDLFGGQ